jgi:beta-phosphoglucomutase-like phosphatase (HAD superfamily)
VTISDMQPGEDRPQEAILFDLDGVIASSEVQKSQAHIETVIELNGTPSQKLNELYTDVTGLSYEETRDRFLECGNIVGTPEAKKADRELYRSIYRTKLQEAIRLAAYVKHYV